MPNSSAPRIVGVVRGDATQVVDLTDWSADMVTVQAWCRGAGRCGTGPTDRGLGLGLGMLSDPVRSGR
ncbi:hypothetical protein ATM97_02520 [Nocardia sp. MH4]|nr:hypothetical protein [Nocardia sp. MH4]